MQLEIILIFKFCILAGQGNAGSRNSEHPSRPCYETGLFPFRLNAGVCIVVMKQEWNVVTRVGYCCLCRYWLISRKIPRLHRNTRRIQWWWTRSKSWSVLELSKWSKFVAGGSSCEKVIGNDVSVWLFWHLNRCDWEKSWEILSCFYLCFVLVNSYNLRISGAVHLYFNGLLWWHDFLLI